jgi:hypothetical protein
MDRQGHAGGPDHHDRAGRVYRRNNLIVYIYVLPGNKRVFFFKTAIDARLILWSYDPGAWNKFLTSRKTPENGTKLPSCGQNRRKK